MSISLATHQPGVLSPTALARDLSIRDLSDPDQGRHAIQLIVDELTGALHRAWNCPLRIVRGHPIVSVEDNYERLGYAADAVTRDARYTRYVSDTCVLRSHTTAMVPPALRALAADPAPPSELLLACPGITYRRDTIDWQHTGTPHQLDLWRLRRGSSPLGEDDLVAMIGTVVETSWPGARWRTTPSPHPYTIAGRQVDVLLGQTWVEVGECGLAAPHVLSGAGLDPGVWSGLAMGSGLDRLLMLRKGIPDVRLLRAGDPRIAEQLLDLAAYRPVSRLPAVRRDLSLIVDAEVDASAEAIGDRVRDALGDDADVAEHVEVRAETAYDALPVAVLDRLSVAPGQRNLLVRMTLRPTDRTLTDGEANILRDRVYAALHDGAVHEWATAR